MAEGIGRWFAKQGLSKDICTETKMMSESPNLGIGDKI